MGSGREGAVDDSDAAGISWPPQGEESRNTLKTRRNA